MTSAGHSAGSAEDRHKLISVYSFLFNTLLITTGMYILCTCTHDGVLFWLLSSEILHNTPRLR